MIGPQVKSGWRRATGFTFLLSAFLIPGCNQPGAAMGRVYQSVDGKVIAVALAKGRASYNMLLWDSGAKKQLIEGPTWSALSPSGRTFACLQIMDSKSLRIASFDPDAQRWAVEKGDVCPFQQADCLDEMRMDDISIILRIMTFGDNINFHGIPIPVRYVRYDILDRKWTPVGPLQWAALPPSIPVEASSRREESRCFWKEYKTLSGDMMRNKRSRVEPDEIWFVHNGQETLLLKDDLERMLDKRIESLGPILP